MTGRTEQWDSQLMLAIAADRQPWLSWVMKLLSVAGSGAIEIPLALLLIFGLWLASSPWLRGVGVAMALPWLDAMVPRGFGASGPAERRPS